jgi:hypothetical protein
MRVVVVVVVVVGGGGITELIIVVMGHWKDVAIHFGSRKRLCSTMNERQRNVL